MSSGALYTAQYILSGNNLYDPLQSGGETSPITTISSLRQLQELRDSTRLGRSQAPKSNLSSVLQAQTLSRSMSGFAPSHPTTEFSRLSLKPRRIPSFQASHAHIGFGSHTFATMKNYLPTYVHENITWNDWNVNDYEYEGAYNTGPQKSRPTGMLSPSLPMVPLPLSST